MAAMAAEVLVQLVAEIAQQMLLQTLVAVVAEHLPDVSEMGQAVVPEL
jgi:hypothetical protein